MMTTATDQPGLRLPPEKVELLNHVIVVRN